ncbi:hypothetical protein BDV34DRAFT_206979, partial [Aspergillus parasiticus]
MLTCAFIRWLSESSFSSCQVTNSLFFTFVLMILDLLRKTQCNHFHGSSFHLFSWHLCFSEPSWSGTMGTVGNH